MPSVLNVQKVFFLKATEIGVFVIHLLYIAYYNIHGLLYKIINY